MIIFRWLPRRVCVWGGVFFANSESPAQYSTVVHEGGHALGIRSGNTGSGNALHHPEIYDSALSARNFCSPTPFDVMALYAVYQTR